MRPIVPLQASMASLSSVLPDDACPTMAKLRMFAEGCVAITPRMRRKWLVCKFHERKVAIAGNFRRSAFSGMRSLAPYALTSRSAAFHPFSLVFVDAARFLRLLGANFKLWSRNRSKELSKIRASFLYF